MKAFSKGVLVLGMVLPNLGLAAPSKCEVQAHSNFQKQSVEVEMASIAGNVSTIELASRRETLQKRLERDQAHCIRLVRHKPNTRTYASAGADSVSL